MDAFLDFRTDRYNALSDFGDAQAQAERLQPVVDEVGRLIVEHELADVVGVALLHKHFDLASEECIVWTDSTTLGRAGAPCVAPASGVVPCVWQWSGDAGQLHPLEFEVSTAASQAARTGALLASKPEFVAQAGATIERAGAAHWIGLASLPAASAHCVQREENDAKLRLSTRSWVPHDQIDGGEGTITLWSFGAYGSRAAMACTACKHKPPPPDVITPSDDSLGKRASVVCTACW